MNLADLKPGDLVCTSKNPYIPIGVVKVTPTGRVVLDNGMQFDPDGTLRGERGKQFYGSSGPTTLESGTPEAILKRRAAACRARLRYFDWNSLSDEFVLQLQSLITAEHPTAVS
jgi:hypothetical protein